MNRRGKVFYMDQYAGVIEDAEEGYRFVYDPEYLASERAQAVSLTLPVREAPYVSKTMIPFFDGLIPEGWLLDIVEKNWKINPRDRMGLLLACCKDCIGAVSVIADNPPRQP
jgi:serine/threonine-protein kinase HipA